MQIGENFAGALWAGEKQGFIPLYAQLVMEFRQGVVWERAAS
jgi:hypothetical protein